MLRTIFQTSLILALPFVGTAAEDYWPGWLGPERNGWVKDFQPPAQWPQTLRKTWQVKVGSGYGTPLVAGAASTSMPGRARTRSSGAWT